MTRVAGALRRPRTSVVLGLLGLLIVVAVVIGAAVGSVRLSPVSLLEMLGNRLGVTHFPARWPPQDEVIFFDLRLPRVVGAALVGLALSGAGTLFQALLRNPLADPYVIGSSGGASLGAVVGVLLSARVTLLGFGLVPALAFLGALTAVALVYRLASDSAGTSVVSLLLAGFAVSTVLSYTVSFLLIVNESLALNLRSFYSWMLGGVSVSAWSQLAVVGPLIVIASAAALGLGRGLNAMTLGDEAAVRLGVSVERHKRLSIVTGSLLTAAAVTIGGPIGFVGLVVPHVVRLLVGPDNRMLLPAAGLAGAAFLVVADLLARSLLAPSDLPVGILTAFLGGPYFLYLLRTRRRGYAL